MMAYMQRDPAGSAPRETLADALELLARRQPAAPAILAPGRDTLTYGHLGGHLRYVREQLRSWDIHPGDIVCGAIPSRPEMAVAIATLPASCTFAPLDPSLPIEAYAVLLSRMKAKAVLVTRHDAHPLRAAARRLDIAEIDLTPERDAAAGLFTIELGQRVPATTGGSAAEPRMAYVLTTSGTTGRRKLVPIEHGAILCDARATRDRLHFTPSDVGVHMTPMHLGQGLRSSVMNALLEARSVVCLPEADVGAFYASIEQFRPTFVIAGFSLFLEILRRARDFRADIAQNRFRFMRWGSGRLDPDDADRLEQLFGVPMLTGLSSTEAVGTSMDPLPPRRRKRGSVGLPLANEVAIRDSSGGIRADGGTGEIVVRGPTVFRGYLDDPELNVTSFVGAWFRTGDLGRIDEDGYVYITGRLDEIINRGGEKISPMEIDLAIESLPGVKEAAVFGIPHRSLGEEMVAAVVREPNAVVDEAHVVEHVRALAGVRKAPRRVYFVERLPRTDNGKLRRAALPELLAVDQDAAIPDSLPAATGSLSPLEGALAGLWAALLQVTAVGREDDFFLLGGDSLTGMQLIEQIDSLFGIELPIESLFMEAATVAGMARTIEAIRVAQSAPRKSQDSDVAAALTTSDTMRRHASRPPTATLGQTAPNIDLVIHRIWQSVKGWGGTQLGARVPVFGHNTQGRLPPVFWCFNAGQEPTAMALTLGSGQPVYAMRSFNSIFADREMRKHYMADLAAIYVDEVVRLHPAGPYLIGGNCGAGPLAECMARHLRTRGLEVAQLSLLEYEPSAPYPGRVAMFFGDRSTRYNPFLRRSAPDAEWKTMHGEAVWDVIPGDHGEYFSLPNIASFMERFASRISEAVKDADN